MNITKRAIYAGASAGMIAFAAFPASAEVRNIGTIPPGQEDGALIAHPKTGSQPAIDFKDQILFNIAKSGADGAIGYFNFRVVNGGGRVTSNISNAFLDLVGPSSYSFSLMNDMKTTLALAAGAYTANVSGRADGRDGGSYNFTITAPTPEPEIWLSMAAGLGLASIVARRRKRKSAA